MSMTLTSRVQQLAEAPPSGGGTLGPLRHRRGDLAPPELPPRSACTRQPRPELRPLPPPIRLAPAATTFADAAGAALVLGATLALWVAVLAAVG